jgi:hypothetical protein
VRLIPEVRDRYPTSFERLQRDFDKVRDMDAVINNKMDDDVGQTRSNCSYVRNEDLF